MNRKDAINKLKTIVDHFDDSDGDVWQKILNVAYAKWQENDESTYADIISWVKLSYGPLAALAVLFGKYNQQVCNGGHAQYFDNGYASAESDGCFTSHKDIKLHEEMIKLFKKYCDIRLKDDVLNILEQFELPLNDDEDDDGDCYYDFEQNNFMLLDDDYYEINDDVVEQMVEMYQNILKERKG